MITSIAITGALYLTGEIQRVLAVAPLSIVGVWDEEFKKFADFDYVLTVLSGSGSKKADTLSHMQGEPLQTAVVNYESVWRLEREILSCKPDLVIAGDSACVNESRVFRLPGFYHCKERTNFSRVCKI